MFRIETTNLSKAIERCKELHPTVRIITFGEYTVTGSKSNTYTVRCFRDEEGFKTVDCSCATRDGVACKHGIAALGMHLYLATVQMIVKRRAQRLARRAR